MTLAAAQFALSSVLYNLQCLRFADSFADSISLPLQYHLWWGCCFAVTGLCWWRCGYSRQKQLQDGAVAPSPAVAIMTSFGETPAFRVAANMQCTQCRLRLVLTLQGEENCQWQ